jgi:hypothetical protein
VHAVPRAERGFILISAFWLLILCGAIVAVLMLRAISSATVAAGEEDALRTRLALESAVETVIADLLFNGPQSRWARFPSKGGMSIDNRPIRVIVSSESGRLDLNEIDLGLLDTALRGLGVDANGRSVLSENLAAKRAANQRIGSPAEIRALLAATLGPNPQVRCIEDRLTIYSGLSRPNESHISPEWARALGMATVASPGRGARIGSPCEGDGGGRRHTIRDHSNYRASGRELFRERMGVYSWLQLICWLGNRGWKCRRS